MRLPRQVYAIQHNITKKIYIGSSARPFERYKNHIYSLRSGKHKVQDMQDDFENYGEDYSFYILDNINTYDERIKEYEWMIKLGTNEREKGYNYKDIATKVLKVPFKNGVPIPKS